MKRYDMTAYDGKKISVVEWFNTDEPCGIVLIAHGMVEHALRYDFIGNKLADNGYIVVCPDARAHGHTDIDTLGYCEGDIFEDTVKDLATLCRSYKEKYPELGIVLFGHSYGSFISQRFIEEHNDLISGVILGGSACMSGVAPVFGGMIAGIGCTFKGTMKPAEFIKNMTFGGYMKKLGTNTFISTIPEEAKRYDEDELCGYTASQAFYKYFFKGLRSVYKSKNLAKLNPELPILIINGTKDPVGDFTKSTEKLFKLYKDKGVKNVEKKYYEGVYHEYLNDTSREESSNDIMNFVRARCSTKAE